MARIKIHELSEENTLTEHYIIAKDPIDALKKFKSNLDIIKKDDNAIIVEDTGLLGYVLKHNGRVFYITRNKKGWE